jgi:sirohydrochlorin cobaltochelatase
MAHEVGESLVRTAVGAPLLDLPEDYAEVAGALGDYMSAQESEATVYVGHGTDHAIWCAYITLQCFLRERYGAHVHVGVVEGGRPTREEILQEVLESGVRRVRLVPLMLVAGTHYLEDLVGEDDSWKKTFEDHRVSVTMETNGIGYSQGIINVFMRHISEVLDAVPR